MTRRIVSYAAEVRTAEARELTLSSAILIYTHPREAYASAHAVSLDDDGRPQIGAGAPLTRASLGELAAQLGAAAAVSGFVPEELVYVGPGVVAWWVPARWRRIWFDCRRPPAGDQTADDAGRQAIGRRSAEVPHPPLVFAVTGDDWHVRALTNNARPRADSPLAVAPYFNVWESGRICTGNVRLPGSVSTESLREWEDAFFRSKFTHPNAPRICAHPQGGYAMWTEVLDRADLCTNYRSDFSDLRNAICEPFPTRHLLPAKQTLSAWIADITKGEV